MLWHAHMLIIATYVLLRAAIAPVVGAPILLEAKLATMLACRLAAERIVAAAPKEHVTIRCTGRFGA